MMKKFEVPQIKIQKLAEEDIFTTKTSDCTVEALGCYSCYCIGVDCDTFSCDKHDCGCFTYW